MRRVGTVVTNTNSNVVRLNVSKLADERADRQRRRKTVNIVFATKKNDYAYLQIVDCQRTNIRHSIDQHLEGVYRHFKSYTNQCSEKLNFK